MNAMDAYERLQEAARQLHDDLVRHERFCSNCSSPTPSGGLCASCIVTLSDAGATRDVSYLPDVEIFSPGSIDYQDIEASGSFSTDEDIESEDHWANLEDHHIFPRKFEDEFKEAGVDIDMYTLTLYEFQHKVLHSDGWNADWNMFFEMYSEGGVDPNVDDVMDFGVYMIEKYGLETAIPHPYKDRTGELGSHLL